MIKESLFNIPCWKIQIINFEEKKKKLTKLLESYPEEKDPTRKFIYYSLLENANY